MPRPAGEPRQLPASPRQMEEQECLLRPKPAGSKSRSRRQKPLFSPFPAWTVFSLESRVWARTITYGMRLVKTEEIVMDGGSLVARKWPMGCTIVQVLPGLQTG